MISYHLISKEGERDYNEDSIGYAQHDNCFLFLLADGLGGHGRGEMASAIALDQGKNVFADNFEDIEKCLNLSFKKAQDNILAMQKLDRACMDMKTTMVALHITEEKIRWGHIGDSRLYYFSNKKLVSYTADHSVPYMLYIAGSIKEKEIRRHPDRNRLLRVLGTDWETPKYELSEEINIETKQYFLLCSDGFWDFIDEKNMEKTL